MVLNIRQAARQRVVGTFAGITTLDDDEDADVRGSASIRTEFRLENIQDRLRVSFDSV
jgi:hypothetical protein